MNKVALQWIVGNDTGVSSEAIWSHMMGIRPTRLWGDGHPIDPYDLGRCLRLLELIPEWKPRIGEMVQYGPGWAALVREWDRLAMAMEDEVGIDWSKGRIAERTHNEMKKLLRKAGVE